MKLTRSLVSVATLALLCSTNSAHAHTWVVGDDEAEQGSTSGLGAPANPTSAGAPEKPASQAMISGNTATVEVSDIYSLSTGVVAGGSAAARPRCVFTQVPITEDGMGGRRLPYRRMDTNELVDAPGPGIERYMYVDCAGQARTTRWVLPNDAIDRAALIRTATDRAAGALPDPAVVMSPAPEHGAPVQLGLWLAIEDPGQLNVVAQAGPVWAAVTVRFRSVAWDMGNGDVVECEGVGSPITELDTVEQGPCGYTYRLPSDLGMRTITVTSQWEAWLTTSEGRDESLGAMSASTSFEYRVFEIVTVGGPG
jgi:hypothetical protein